MSKTILWLRVFVLIVCIFTVGPLGCATMPEQLSIQPVVNRERIALTAEDTLQIMRQAGFNDDDIIELGPSLRNGFASHGAARISSEDKTHAMFVVQGDVVHCTSSKTGTFIYDVATKQFR